MADQRIRICHAVVGMHRQRDCSEETRLFKCKKFEIGKMFDSDAVGLRWLSLNGRDNQVLAD
jgi:hypothetical protein